MFLNIKHHKILKVLYKNYYIKEKESKYGLTVSKNLSTIEIHERTSYSIKTIDDVCTSLLNYKYIKLTHECPNLKVYQYVITDDGKNAFIKGVFIKNYLDFWAIWIPIVISLYALTISTLACRYSNSNRENYKELQKELNQLKIELNNHSSNKK